MAKWAAAGVLLGALISVPATIALGGHSFVGSWLMVMMGTAMLLGSLCADARQR